MKKQMKTKIKKTRTVGLALGSGGARGYAHIGVIKVLMKYNIPIHFISGTSMGALVAAYYALNLDVEGLENIALNFKKTDFLKLVDLNNPKISLIKGKKVRKYLKGIFGDATFRKTKIPLRIGATALEDGSKVIFKSGKIVDAVMASGAFPGVFPPVKFKGKHLVDGGLTDATPVSLLDEFEPDVIIGVDLFGLSNEEKSNYYFKDTLARTLEIIMSRLSTYGEKSYRKNIVVLKPEMGSRFQTFAFYNARKNINAGIIEAEKHINKIKRLLR